MSTHALVFERRGPQDRPIVYLCTPDLRARALSFARLTSQTLGARA